MKNMLKNILLLSSIFIISPSLIQAQNNTTREIILSAMKDELVRNMEQLQLENMQKPFFISYTVRDFCTMEVSATLGSIVTSNENHIRNYNVRVMVGDYKFTDENFRDASPGSFQNTLLQGTDDLPLEDDYYGIRRALWIATDRVYKSASEKYERKKASLEQQELSDEEKELEDFSKAPVVKYQEPPRKFDMDRSRWEKIAKEISAMFKYYPDIYSSQVRFFFFQGDGYFINSEGTEVVQPMTLVYTLITAETQAIDGEPLNNLISYIGLIPQDLPPVNSIKQAVKNMAEQLVTLRIAPVFEESYTGPVMFEDQAVGELISQQMFEHAGGLLAFRTPIMAGSTPSRRIQSHSLEDKIGTRILSRDLTIKAMPTLDTFSDMRLIGSYKVDEEGVKPPQEIILVENGILKTLLSNRTPTFKIKESNGHDRPLISFGRFASSRLGPSVILAISSDGKAKSDMKDELLQLAQEEGLEYAIVLRKVMSLSQPILVYRVYVEDGKEELTRSVRLSRPPLSSLRRIYSVSTEQFLYQKGGIPASYIVPQSLIFEELEVEQEKRVYTPKLPVVPSPLLRN
ncbi:MAG: hypothetical protein JSW07_13980 [bacterium]|nr:MAG: hypothetical protein JSW07_13980 [bacterium]